MKTWQEAQKEADAKVREIGRRYSAERLALAEAERAEIDRVHKDYTKFLRELDASNA